MMVSTSYAVVICAHTARRWDDLRAAVDSVSIQTLRPTEVIVVVDHNPELLERAQRQFDGLKIVPNRRTQGLSGARNTGVLEASSDVVAFLDDDAVARPDWLERFDRHYAHRRFGGGKVLGVGGSAVAAWDGGRPSWFPREFEWVVGCSHRGLPTRVASVRNPIGCNMSFWRSVLLDAGGFDERFGRTGSGTSGCEETELCIRARARTADGVFLYDPSARVSHRVREERATVKYFVSRCLGEGASKAEVAQLRGGKSLATESSYVLRVLPLGMAQALTSRHRDGVRRAAMIPLGLGATVAGYARGRIRRHSHHEDPRLVAPLEDARSHGSGRPDGNGSRRFVRSSSPFTTRPGQSPIHP